MGSVGPSHLPLPRSKSLPGGKELGTLGTLTALLLCPEVLAILHRGLA